MQLFFGTSKSDGFIELSWCGFIIVIRIFDFSVHHRP